MSQSKRPANRTISRRLAAFALAATVSLSVAACQGSASPGAASYANGIAITERQVSEATEQWTQLTGQSMGRVQVVEGLTTAVLLDDAVAQIGLELTDETVEAELQNIIDYYGSELTVADVTPSTRMLIRSALIGQQVQTAGNEENLAFVMEAVNGADVKLNPRYNVTSDANGFVLMPLGDAITLAPQG